MKNKEPFISIKWPGLLISGKSVTSEQAAEIMIRTSRWPLNLPHHKIYFEKSIYKMMGAQKTILFDKYSYDWDSLDILMKDHGILPIQYLSNDFIEPFHYLFGKRGWCDWQGEIGCHHYNIGKWPTLEDISNDLSIIAAAFPYLELEVQVLSDEIGLNHISPVAYPTAQWSVSNGKVTAPFFPTSKIIDKYTFEKNGFDLYKNDIDISLIELGIKLARESQMQPCDQVKLTNDQPIINNEEKHIFFEENQILLRLEK